MAEPGDEGVAGDVLDEVLVAARADAPWAFEHLYARFAPAVSGYLRMHGATDPEGLTNEVMLGVFRGLPSFEGEGTGFRSWLFTIAHRRLIDERRRASVRPKSDELVEERHERPGGDVEVEALSGLEDERVRTLLDGLTAEQREVVLLRVVADLSVEQVAQVLDKRTGAVKMLQRHGLARLRRILETQGVTS